MKELDHKLIVKDDRVCGFRWTCACGKAAGTGKSHAAVSVAYSKHLTRVVMEGK